jgi:FAD/FMN-containing dehydrogenase
MSPRFVVALLATAVCVAATADATAHVNTCLEAALRGAAPAHYPGSQTYDEVTRVTNERFDVRPAAVVEPRSERDVAAAISAATACKLHFSVVNGGHSAASYGFASQGLTMTMRGMKSITFPSTAPKANVTIGGGALWVDVYRALNRSADGAHVVGGGCPTVGVSGFLLGGGWSFLSRHHGLGIDTILSATVVLANASVVTLSPADATGGKADLFWAIRGGGGGNFGVLTSVTVKVFAPQPRGVTVGELCYPELSPHTPRLMKQWIDGFAAMPRYLNVLPCWLPMGAAGNNSRMFCFTVVCDSSPERCAPHVARLRRAAPATVDTVNVQPYIAWSIGNGGKTSAQREFLYLKSFTLPALTADVVHILIDAIKGAVNDRALVLFHIAGGAVNEVAGNATAFPHRGLQVLLQVKAIWGDGGDAAANMRWIDGIAAKVDRYANGAYVNYIDPHLGAWRTKYYGANYPRLKSIKRSVDPSNFFHFSQSVDAL